MKRRPGHCSLCNAELVTIKGDVKVCDHCDKGCAVPNCVTCRGLRPELPS